MTTLNGWVTVPIRGQLDGIGPRADIDDAGAYPLTVSVRRDAVPELLQALVKATTTAAAEEARPTRHTGELAVFADQLARAYEWRRMEELEKEDPDAAAKHREAAEELWPWMLKGPERALREKWQRGWAKGKEHGYRQGAADHAHDAEHIALATELRIPCPEAADPGRPDGAPVLQPEPLILRKNTTGRPKGWEDGWSICNPNLHPPRQVWTNRGWQRDGDLHGNAIYRWTREEAVAEAQRLAEQETRRFETWIAEMRADR